MNEIWYLGVYEVIVDYMVNWLTYDLTILRRHPSNVLW